jgi:hypothetical protein
MTPDELPTSVTELQALVLAQHQRVQLMLAEKETLHRQVVTTQQ